MSQSISRLDNRRGRLSLVLAGFLCCVGPGCGEESGEFRTYEQTLAEAGPADDPVGRPADAEQVSEPVKADPPAPTGSGTTDPGNVAVEPADEGVGDVAATPASVTDGEPVVAAVATVSQVPAGDGSADETNADISVASTGPRKIELLIAENEFQTQGPEGALRVSYNDIDLLKVLNMDPVPRSAPSYFPDWLTALEGTRVRIRGFMYPPLIETGIPVFLLARDNQICCFGKNPMPYDIIPVILRDDVTTDYINGRPFDVVGVFHIGVEMNLDDPTRVKTVYYIDDAIVIDE